MPPARPKTSTFRTRQRALLRKHTLDAEIKRFGAFLESKNTVNPLQPMQALAGAAPTPASSARSQLPGPATLSEDMPAPPDNAVRYDTELIGQSDAWDGLNVDSEPLPPDAGPEDEPNPLDDLAAGIQATPPTYDDEPTIGLSSSIAEIDNTARFIELLKSAKLDDSNMENEDIQRLRDAQSSFPFDVWNEDFLFALRSFLAVSNASQKTFDKFRSAAMARHQDSPFLSYDQIKRRVEQLSGVIPISHDMCPDSCAAFTGPFSSLDKCPVCFKPRYQYTGASRSKRVPQRQFHTIPIGPVIQALYRSPESAALMQHRLQRTKVILKHLERHSNTVDIYDDVYTGSDYLEAVFTHRIRDDDVMLQISLDGAQLFRDKESDCFIYIYIIHNLPPDLRYKKRYVIPGGFVPGPNKPKNLDSFIFPGLYHLSALQNEGLRIWDASRRLHIKHSIPFLAFTTADGPVMADLAGTVGHSGKYGCRLYCGLPGRHRAGDGHYYPALMKPNNYTVDGCEHGDISFTQLQALREKIPLRYKENLRALSKARNTTEYHKIRLQTGLCKPSILSGVKATLGVPNMFVMDIMHLVTLNDTDLLINLWRGKLRYYGNDHPKDWGWTQLGVNSVWKAHGKTVAMATPFLPSSFDRAPRNPAEKINSGYKAWEFLLYIFALGPALLQPILPDKYWRNYCKLVRGIQLLQQRSIPYDKVTEGTRLLRDFVKEFEQLYYQRNPDRLHFVRQSIHLLTHIGPETVRAGPLACYAQWTMETAIGSLGEEIRQDRDPYANISQRGILRAQTNAINYMLPELNLESSAEQSTGDGYVLLPACDDVLRDVSQAEGDAILKYWDSQGWPNAEKWPKAVKRWGRLRLPNGQLVRSTWVESRSRRQLRRTTIVKISTRSGFSIAEIKYFFRLQFGCTIYSLAVLSLFSPPNPELLEKSHHTVYASRYQGEHELVVIDIRKIMSLVAMIPYYRVRDDGTILEPEDEYFLVEKPYLDITHYRGEVESDPELDGYLGNENEE